MLVKVSLLGKLLGYKSHIWPSQDIHLKIINLSNIGETHIKIYLKPKLFISPKIIEIHEQGLNESNYLRGYLTGLSYQPSNITTLLA